MRIFMADGLVGMQRAGPEAGRDLVVVVARLEIALDIHRSAAVEGQVGREGVMVSEDDDDRGGIRRDVATSEHGEQHAAEPFQMHGDAAGALARGVADHFEMR